MCSGKRLSKWDVFNINTKGPHEETNTACQRASSKSGSIPQGMRPDQTDRQKDLEKQCRQMAIYKSRRAAWTQSHPSSPTDSLNSAFLSLEP